MSTCCGYKLKRKEKKDRKTERKMKERKKFILIGNEILGFTRNKNKSNRT